MLALKRCVTVLLNGTSLTNGRLATSWDKDLQKALEQAVDRPVRVVNRGKGSQTSSSWGVPMSAGDAALQPDFFVTEGYGINNCAMGVSRSQAQADLTTIVSTFRTNSPRTRICVQTMSPASSGDSLRTNLSQYYADEMTLARTLGCDTLNNYVNWPNPLPVNLTQVDPNTGLPDGLHPNQAANRLYFFPAIVAYLTPLILSAH
jgi:lysophospholipase L1-like esterase